MNQFESAENTPSQGLHPAHKGGNVLTLKTLNTFAVDVITLPNENELFCMSHRMWSGGSSFWTV